MCGIDDSSEVYRRLLKELPSPLHTRVTHHQIVRECQVCGGAPLVRPRMHRILTPSTNTPARYSLHPVGHRFRLKTAQVCLLGGRQASGGSSECEENS